MGQKEPQKKPQSEKKKIDAGWIVLIALLVVCCAVAVIFSMDITLSEDETVNALLIATIPRLVTSVFLIVAIIQAGYHSMLHPKLSSWPHAMLWSIPCLLVALANFPFTALLSGEAVVERTDLLWLFLIECLSIGLMEELFFRGLIFPFILEKLQDRKHGILVSVVLSGLIFGLWHLTNLFTGAGVAETLMQVVYTFLMGCMWSIAILKTDNMWLGVFTHTLFDVGGMLVTQLGSGSFQDMWFWLFTVVFGVLCALHVVFTLVRIKSAPFVPQKKKAEEAPASTDAAQ